MKVLLISPLPNLDPPNGDVTYTQSLLSNPPAGVEYETYADALSRGALREHGTRRSLGFAVKNRARIFEELLLAFISKGVNLLRKRRLLFWEPVRFFSVRSTEYDAVHMHVFSASFVAPLDCPLIISTGAPQRDVYLDFRHYSLARVQRLERLEIALAKALHVNLNSYYLPDVSRVIAWTQHTYEWYVQRRYVSAEAIDIIPSFLSAPPVKPKPVGSTVPIIGFVAKDFNGKGGPTLLAAFDKVKKEKPDARLWIIGSPQQMTEEEAVARGIKWTPHIPRTELLAEAIPTFDVFAYPTGFDCISYVTLEAISRGLAVATSDYTSLPEVVDHGRAGLISPIGDAESLADNILKLLEPSTNDHYRRAAREHFEKTFSADVVVPRIRASYDAAAEQFRASK